MTDMNEPNAIQGRCKRITSRFTDTKKEITRASYLFFFLKKNSLLVCIPKGVGYGERGSIRASCTEEIRELTKEKKNTPANEY